METREPSLDSWERLSRTWMDDQLIYSEHQPTGSSLCCDVRLLASSRAPAGTELLLHCSLLSLSLSLLMLLPCPWLMLRPLFDNGFLFSCF